MNILDFEEQERAEQQRLTFEVFGETVDLDVPTFSGWFGVDRFQFFTFDQLRDIAAEKRGGEGPSGDTDFDELPGVYVFTNLVRKAVLKVGESDNVRRRVGRDHLRYGNAQSPVTVRDHYRSQPGTWPEQLVDYQLTLCVFRMAKAHEKLRWSAELWLQAKLFPELR